MARKRPKRARCQAAPAGTAPPEVLALVERFREHLDSYRDSAYKEARVRREFIDPFFEALGWDVQNKQGYAEAYKDVVHEDAVKVGGTTEAPDYGFRIGGVRKFFVEAKKPSVSVEMDIHPAYKLRRYAWSAKLPLSILTDFEEFAVYDCRIRPKRTDKASAARILYMTFEDYPARWSEIAEIFSKEAVLKGSFDRYAEKRRRRGTATVDEAFLAEIEKWRDSLARNIALRNPEIGVRDLNFAVQRTIDRIIFLRMCEDRGAETYQNLLSLVNGPKVYPRLMTLFERADDKYNSGLFHFRSEKGRPPPDELTPGLKIDDEVLRSLLSNLYYPQSPYEFSVLGADILGQVYEQFLGKVIRLTSGHRAKVEEKPEVKKAGGVYYTPVYIVRYIVENTVGRLIKGKTPRQVSRLRILDPACGSGSFLIGAYEYFLNYHRDWYVEHDPKKHKKKAYQGAGGQWFLTIQEKKRILLNNIYGVDIDSQAVEVTKLSLLLKVLEGENQDSLGRQMRLFHKERALPDLASNIKCGNSLIGPDFFDGRQMSLLEDEEEAYRVNPFDWEAEFPEILGPKVPKNRRGFDAVIGNPPYVRVRVFKELYPNQASYLQARYQCATHVWDIYLLFLERALALTYKRGFFSFIVPVQTLHQPNCESLRRLLLAESSIRDVVDLSRIRVFQKAVVKNCILVCQGGKPDKGSCITTRAPVSSDDLFRKPARTWPQDDAAQNPLHSLKLDLLSPKKNLCEKLRSQGWQLDELCYVTFGLRSCARRKGQGGKDRLITPDGTDPLTRPYLEGREIARYTMNPAGRFIRYIPEEMYSPRTPSLFESTKIISQTMLSKMRLIATLDLDRYYVEQSLLCILPHGVANQGEPAEEVPLEFILGVINSRVESFYFATYIIDYSLGGGLVHATPGSQAKLLIPRASERKMQKMISFVQRMLDLNERLAKAKNPNEKTRLQRLINATDCEIDKLVYELYGLTPDEIRIVEEATA